MRFEQHGIIMSSRESESQQVGYQSSALKYHAWDGQRFKSPRRLGNGSERWKADQLTLILAPERLQCSRSNMPDQVSLSP